MSYGWRFSLQSDELAKLLQCCMWGLDSSPRVENWADGIPADGLPHLSPMIGL